MRRSAYVSVAAALIATGLVVPLAYAEPFDIDIKQPITINLDVKGAPSFKLPLTRNSGETFGGDLSFSASAGGVPLGADCEFVARPALAAVRPSGDATEEVLFELRNKEACKLASLGVDELTLDSDHVDDTPLVAKLERPASFPIGNFSGAIIFATLLSVVVVGIGVVLAHRRLKELPNRKDPRFWRHSLDVPKLEWSFKDSWMSTLTAAGAVLAALLGTTDVLDTIGPGKPVRKVFLFVNVAALALTASAPLAYNALRGYRVKKTVPRQVKARVLVRASRNGSARTLKAWLPAIRYGSDNGRLTDPVVASSADAASHEWTRDDQHIAVVRIPTTIGSGSTVAPDETCCVGLDIPPAGHHADRVSLWFDVALPELQIDQARPGPPVVPEYESIATFEPHGRFVGLMAAALVATVAVGVQLAGTHSVLAESNLGGGAKTVASALIVGLAVVAAAYVITTLSTRLLIVETSGLNESPVARTGPPIHRFEGACASVTPKPVQPLVVVPEHLLEFAEGDVVDESSLEQHLVEFFNSAPLPQALTYPGGPTPRYPSPLTGTSPGDSPPLRVAERRVDSAF